MKPAVPPATRLDYTPLTAPMTAGEIEDYGRRVASKGMSDKTLRVISISLIVLFGLAIGIPYLISGADFHPGPWIIVAIFVGVTIGAMYYGAKKRRETLARLVKFAATNGLGVHADVSNPGYAGMIYSIGHTRSIKEALVFSDGLELGNYQYVTGSGKSRAEHNFGYMRFRLSRALPHMVLDAKENNVFGFLSNLPASFNRSQTLSLEGEFDKHFTLYAPKQYERDALYVFTPDVMAALIDYGRKYDIEIIDREIFLYYPAPFKLTSPEEIQRLLSIATLLTKEVHEQAVNYRDERTSQSTRGVAVAVQGSRLKRGFGPWAAVILVMFGLSLTPLFARIMGMDTEHSWLIALPQLVISGFMFLMIGYGIYLKLKSHR